jgi:tetratricopeptide (TPR) repeat protein
MLPPMPFRRRLRTLALVGCIAAAVPLHVSFAQEPVTPAVATARKHFDKARAYYGQGAYREAVAELEAAHQLDPNAKDLVFNLGVVHEKLADIDEALTWFRLYTTMDLVPQERDRADAYIRRLEGAKRELEEKLAAQQQPPPEPTGAPPAAAAPHQANPQLGPPLVPPRQPPARLPLPPPPPPPPPPNGRVDALTVGAASLSSVALAVGVVLAVKAERDQPTHYVTGTDGTYEELVHRVDSAWHEAIAADIGFGVALVSGITTAYLYFGRPRSGPHVSTGSTTVSAGPLPGGGTLMLKGSF